MADWKSWAVRASVACAVGGLLGSSVLAYPKPPTPLDAEHLRWPAWLQKPSALAMEKVYPKRAWRDHVSGVVVMRCQVTSARTLSQCAVTAEDPPGYGFGDAALKLAPTFHLTPAGPGLPADGEFIKIPLNFGSWAYRKAAPVNYRPGDSAILMTELKGARPPGRAVFHCIDPDAKARYCLWIGVTWKQRPDKEAIRKALAASDLASGTSRLDCRATESGELVDCRMSGANSAKAQVALFELAKGFAIAPTAQDGAPVVQGRIVIDINWALLKAFWAGE